MQINCKLTAKSEKEAEKFIEKGLPSGRNCDIITSACAKGKCTGTAGTVLCEAPHERPEIQKLEKRKMNKLEIFANEQIGECPHKFNVGDTIRIHNKIKEGARERIQLFEGTVIARHGGGVGETFTVRRVAYGVGVEKTFPLHSPNVAKVEVIRHGKVRRAKLYYLRDRVGKSSKVKELIEK